MTNNDFTSCLWNNNFESAKKLFNNDTILYVQTGSLNVPEKPINEFLLYACSHKDVDMVIWLFDMLEKVTVRDQYDSHVYSDEFEYNYEEIFMASIKMANINVSKYLYLIYIDDELCVEIINEFIKKYLSKDKYTELYIYLLMINDIDKTKLDQIDMSNEWINKQIKFIQGLRS